MVKPKLVECLERAGKAVLVIRSSGDLKTREKKGIWDIVTEGDCVAERVITDWLAKHFGEDGIEAEEGTTRPSQSGRVWYPDPVDGTTNYSCGAPFFGISAGRAGKTGAPDLGAIHFPVEGWSVWASRNGGAFSDHPKISGRLIVRPGADVLKNALIGADFPQDHEYLFEILKPKARNVVILGSATYETLLVVLGYWDAYFHISATQFDVAAAELIAKEAGCTVTGIHEGKMDLRKKSIPFLVTRSKKLSAELRDILIENWR